MRLRRTLQSFLLIILLFLVLLPSTGKARLAVTPLFLSMEVLPGQNGSKALTISNTGQQTVDVNIQLVDWWRTPEGDLQILSQGTRERSCADWLFYSPTTMQLEPAEERQLSVEIEVPEGVSGDHWAMLLITEEASQADEEQQGATQIVVNYAIKIIQRDPGTEKKEATISGIELTQRNPMALSITYKNTGPTHLKTTGTVDIRNIQGETVREYEISEFPALPGEKHIVEVASSEESEPLSPGTYYAIAVMDFGGDNLVQGGLPIEISGNTDNSK